MSRKVCTYTKDLAPVTSGAFNLSSWLINEIIILPVSFGNNHESAFVKPSSNLFAIQRRDSALPAKYLKNKN